LRLSENSRETVRFSGTQCMSFPRSALRRVAHGPGAQRRRAHHHSVGARPRSAR
jgi:hypothetical protein